ncbi:MAG TPA: imidazole glycerol phosphate synthase subunit HisH [Alphaproteobacteria bacterium]|nr:imidazole glycerol phosphate synthase subunit HisH [Alphaproteobacteria bacterium]
MTAASAAAPTVAVVDYGSGNLRSAAKAFERAAHEAGLSETVAITGDAEVVRRADRIVLPGQGAFADCMRGLRAVPGMLEVLEERVRRQGRPFFGICVGMQLLARAGHEHGVHEGLGWIDATVRRMAPPDPALKVPHMGWNDLSVARPAHPVMAGVAAGSHAYFVHSFAMDCADRADVLAECDYGGPLPAIVGRDSFVGTQFHVEKSQATGLALIANFLRWRP